MPKCTGTQIMKDEEQALGAQNTMQIRHRKGRTRNNI